MPSLYQVTSVQRDKLFLRAIAKDTVPPTIEIRITGKQASFSHALASHNHYQGQIVAAMLYEQNGESCAAWSNSLGETFSVGDSGCISDVARSMVLSYVPEILEYKLTHI